MGFNLAFKGLIWRPRVYDGSDKTLDLEIEHYTSASGLCRYSGKFKTQKYVINRLNCDNISYIGE